MVKGKIKPKLHIVITIVLGAIVPAFMMLVTYESIKNWTFNFNIVETLRVIFYIVMSVFSYYGMMIFVKPLLLSFNSYTKNKFIIKILTILITLTALITLVQILQNYEMGLNYNDRGIIFEMIGFFIFLNPVNKYITNWFVEKNEEGIEHRLITSTTAIGLVIIGLTLQFSYFN